MPKVPAITCHETTQVYGEIVMYISKLHPEWDLWKYMRCLDLFVVVLLYVACVGSTHFPSQPKNWSSPDIQCVQIPDYKLVLF